MKRGFGTVVVLSASLALAGCNSPKPVMVNKTPAAETIMDAGVKEKKPENKLAVVPTKISEEPPAPKVVPIPENPYKTKKQQEAKKNGAREGYAPMKLKGVERSKYDPTKDTDPWYPVDKDGKRINP